MPKQPAKKVYKPRRKEIDDSRDWICVKFKNLDKDEIKRLRREIDEVVSGFFVQETQSEY